MYFRHLVLPEIEDVDMAARTKDTGVASKNLQWPKLEQTEKQNK